MLETIKNGLDGMRNIGNRLKDLSVQYNNDTLSDNDKKLIVEEYKELGKAFNDIQHNTKFNGIRVFDDSKDKELRIQHGVNNGESTSINIGCIGGIREGFEEEFLKDSEKIEQSILKPINEKATYIGVKSVILEGIKQLNEDIQITLGEELSNLEDVDIAKEMMNYSKNDNLLYCSNMMYKKQMEYDKGLLIDLLR